MRIIILLLAALGIAFAAACAWPVQHASAPVAASGWVRTRDGWEQNAQGSSMPRARADLHPLVVASLELQAALLALIAFPTGERKRTKGS